MFDLIWYEAIYDLEDVKKKILKLKQINTFFYLMSKPKLHTII